MKKIEMTTEKKQNFLEVFEMFITSQTAKGVADVTLRNYRYNMKNMRKFFDAEKPFDEVSKRDIETMIVAMRRSGMAHNTIATYLCINNSFHLVLPLSLVFCFCFRGCRAAPSLCLYYITVILKPVILR